MAPGSASKNSLARMNSGARGISPKVARHFMARAPAPTSALALRAERLVSTRSTEIASRNPATARRAHVGHQHARPGPSSTSRASQAGPRRSTLADPDAEHLAEHLADLRRRDEIADARRILGHIIAVRGVAGTASCNAPARSALVGDDRGYLRSERVHARASRRFSAKTSAARRPGSSASTTPSHGQPFAAPPARIGLAENSQNIRANP